MSSSETGSPSIVASFFPQGPSEKKPGEISMSRMLPTG